MLGNTLNAIIIASSFILAFVQFSETSENRRREYEKQKLEKAKKEKNELFESINLSSKIGKNEEQKLNDDYESLVSYPPIEYMTIRIFLFIALIASLVLHIEIISPFIPVAWPVSTIIVIFITLFCFLLFAFGGQWVYERGKTKEYITACNQLQKTFVSICNLAQKIGRVN